MGLISWWNTTTTTTNFTKNPVCIILNTKKFMFSVWVVCCT
jgi:hypothetical protein